MGAGDQYDHHRVGARKVLRLACRVGAHAHVPTLARQGGAAADAADAVATVPVRERSRVSEQRRFVRRERRHRSSEILEGGTVADRREPLFFLMRQVASEIRGALLVNSEEDDFVRERNGDRPRFFGERRQTRAIAGGDQAAVAPDGNDPRGRRPQTFRQAGGVGAQMRRAIQRAAGIGHAQVHRRTLTQRRAFGNAPGAGDSRDPRRCRRAPGEVSCFDGRRGRYSLFGRLTADGPLANPVRSGRKQP